ncbi:3-hydroxyacyl-ACP dehydratase FabZ family protein [Orbus mooreae]|uniref:3-hydroxyacyl-ACP dehydratase FabZ family protein n=1 Tax=Orbus mooreae TaxID=3074107 RepID=UPI00370D9577
MEKTLPNELNITINANGIDLELDVPDDLLWFKGHFPERPLLPGVTQLNWVMHYSKKLLNIQAEIASIDVIKFQTPILPNDRLHLNIVWDSDLRKLQFFYMVANKIASSGKLKLCP